MKDKYIGFVRVSSREQEREGFSLDVQEEALRKWAKQNGGEIIQMFRIAETASKRDKRKTFNEMLAYAKKHAHEVDGVLFYKIDRAARNLSDYMKLEELEEKYGLRFISTSQPIDDQPAGRMARRMLASIAAFYTEQQSIDVKDGMNKRVENGLFVTKAPYGYKNVKVDDRRLITVEPEKASNVKRIFELFAFHSLTIEQVIETMAEEGRVYVRSKPKWSYSKVYAILLDRSYVGEVRYHDGWHRGTHKPLVDSVTWSRVQFLLGQTTYRAHQMVYAGELIRCGHCGSPVTGEVKTKQTKKGEKSYTYYRCTKYHVGNHPRIRLTESELDEQVLAMIGRMKVESPQLRAWFQMALKRRESQRHSNSVQRVEELKRQLSLAEGRIEEALNMRLAGDLDEAKYDKKRTELEQKRDQLRALIASLREADVDEATDAVHAADVFRLIEKRWADADYPVKRRILETIFNGFVLTDKVLVPDNGTPLGQLSA
ncbi:hypothetical protein Spb1_22740 [Planctopirus ephydatiae]|uniref:DNA-invertase hin n=1 Tax=Planctopirus ephydatiae TaxID=2528019 RepID=A0A518GNY6_9PLAN|nr:recombinase family protein [Planctopirus ephydatiae]QDV30345.1 hypothetical protein Spb1_22740 [Planctopirus ephydatiae]